jgi:hypothetical protein
MAHGSFSIMASASNARLRDVGIGKAALHGACRRPHGEAVIAWNLIAIGL